MKRTGRVCSTVRTPASRWRSLKKLVARGDIRSKERVVVISTANGLKFADFKIGYHEERLPGITSHHANHPIALPNDYGAVIRALEHSADMKTV